MSARLAFLLSLSACSLDYLELRTDEPLGSGGSAGAGGCACGAPSENVIYDENFDAPGWCNPGIRTFAGLNATLDPDHVEEGEACGALRIACPDPTANCEAHAYDTFDAIAGPLYLHVRLAIHGPWLPPVATQIYALDLGQQSIPMAKTNTQLFFEDAGTGTKVRVCGDMGCNAGEFVLNSDHGWHTVVIFNPHDGVGYLQYQWDGGPPQEFGGLSWPASEVFTHINIGWTISALATAPDFLLDNLRICNEAGAADCGWQ